MADGNDQRDGRTGDQGGDWRGAANGKKPIEFPEGRLLVRPWDDPLVEQLGHDPRSLYVERFWVCILGPTATLLLRRLAAGLEVSPPGFEIDPVALAFELGLGIRGGKNSPFWRAIDRTSRFNATRRNGEVLMVRRKIAPLNLHQAAKLPPHLQAAHQAWVDRQLDARPTLRPQPAAEHPSMHRPDAA